MIRSLLNILAISALFTVVDGADAPAKKPAPAVETIQIASTNGFEYDIANGTAAYIGSVKVMDSTMTILCERLNVKFASDAGGTNKPASTALIANDIGGRVKQIEALGKVEITNRQDGSKATGERALFTAAEQKVVLSGNRPTYTRSNGSAMRADEIIFDRSRGKFIAKGRIETVFKEQLNLFNATTRPPTMKLR